MTTESWLRGLPSHQLLDVGLRSLSHERKRVLSAAYSPCSAGQLASSGQFASLEESAHSHSSLGVAIQQRCQEK